MRIWIWLGWQVLSLILMATLIVIAIGARGIADRCGNAISWLETAWSEAPEL